MSRVRRGTVAAVALPDTRQRLRRGAELLGGVWDGDAPLPIGLFWMKYEILNYEPLLQFMHFYYFCIIKAAGIKVIQIFFLP